MTHKISTDILKAAMICASSEQIRYYLNGVYIDPKGYVVSTDGHRMFVAKVDAFGGKGFIIPAAILKRVLTGNKAVAIAVSDDTIDGQKYEPVDGTYPDWRRVVPGKLSGAVAQFNPAYVGDMGKIAKLLGPKSVEIHHNGDGPAGVSFTGRADCFAVLMPVRVVGDDWSSLTALVEG